MRHDRPPEGEGSLERQRRLAGFDGRLIVESDSFAKKVGSNMSWKLIIDIGHTAVALPLAAAIAAWLVTGRAWKLALCWCLMFAAGLGLVALSKIAYLGWDAGIPAIGFKALSGHALCTTAVIPVLLFVLLQGAPGSWRRGGVILGIWISVGLGVLLVRFDYHTASEVLASFMLGTLISLGYMRLAEALPAPRIDRWTVPLSISAFLLIFALNPSVINYRLVDVALFLSGRDQPFQWTEKSRKLMCKAPSPVNR